MTAIWDFQQLDELEAYIERLSTQAIAVLTQELDDERAELAARSNLERIFVTRGWANDNAERGETPLSVLLFCRARGG